MLQVNKIKIKKQKKIKVNNKINNKIKRRSETPFNTACQQIKYFISLPEHF